MLKKFLSLGLTLMTLCLLIQPVQAASFQECKEDVVRALENVMGMPGRDALHGYLKQMSDLGSTNLPTHVLIQEVEQLARDARLELNSVCREAERFESMDSFYAAAYDLQSCKAFVVSEADAAASINILSFCERRAQEQLDTLLDSIREYLLRQAVRTSMEPVVQRMRSLNARLTVLITEYSRLVNNFFTFSFRLGDTITGERD